MNKGKESFDMRQRKREMGKGEREREGQSWRNTIFVCVALWIDVAGPTWVQTGRVWFASSSTPTSRGVVQSPSLSCLSHVVLYNTVQDQGVVVCWWYLLVWCNSFRLIPWSIHCWGTHLRGEAGLHSSNFDNSHDQGLKGASQGYRASVQSCWVRMLLEGIRDGDKVGKNVKQ